MATATTQQEAIDLDAIEEDARRRIGELTEHRKRLSLDALTDEDAKRELATVESEILAAERVLEQTELAGDERERRSLVAEHAAAEKARQAAMRRASKLEPEVPVSEQKIDADMRKLAETLAQHVDLLDRLSAELRVAGTDRDLALRPWAVPAALAHHLSACGVRGLVDLPPITGGPRPLVEER